jgi:hypothetical protein
MVPVKLVKPIKMPEGEMGLRKRTAKEKTKG